jgi:maltose alpha-D-glucosyltransferase/alpha-amylase
MVQEFIENNGDLWTYMLDRLVHFNERILSQEEANLPPMRSGASVFEPISYLDIPQEIIHLMEGPVIEQARLLGVRTGEMHLALGARSDLKDFQPEEYSLHYQRSIFASLKPLVRASFQNLTKSIKGLPEESRSEAKEVLNMMDEILNEMKKVYRKKIDIVKIRIHGDYHLGQVLFTGKDLVIMDFEGEPSRSYSERRIKRSPLRDVASMVRSFHYVVYGGLFLNNQVRKEDINRVLPYSEMWHNYMSGIFMQAYMETVDGHAFIPKDKEDLDVLMRTFLLEKAVYELNYELNSRPDWVIVPLKGIKAIMQGEVSVKV